MSPPPQEACLIVPHGRAEVPSRLLPPHQHTLSHPAPPPFPKRSVQPEEVCLIAESGTGVPPLTSQPAPRLPRSTPAAPTSPASHPPTCLIFAPFTSDLCPNGTPYPSPEHRSGYPTARARRSVGTPHTLASLARRGLSNCARTFLPPSDPANGSFNGHHPKSKIPGSRGCVGVLKKRMQVNSWADQATLACFLRTRSSGASVHMKRAFTPSSRPIS